MPSLRCFRALLLLPALGWPATTAQGQVRYLSPPSLPPARGYSQVAEVAPGSRLVFLSGQVPLDSTGQLVGSGDFEAQAVQVFENIQRGLAAAETSFRQVVKITFYVTDASSQLSTLRMVRDRYLDPSAQPTSTLIQVGALFRPDVLLEVEVTAVIPIEARE